MRQNKPPDWTPEVCRAEFDAVVKIVQKEYPQMRCAMILMITPLSEPIHMCGLATTMPGATLRRVLEDLIERLPEDEDGGDM